MRLSIPLLIIFATFLQATQCDACCLTDWLCGRETAYVVGYAPYTAAYAPVAATPYAAGYAPVAATPYAAGYAPVAATPYAAGYAPVATTQYVAGYAVDPTGSTVVSARPAVAAPAASNGVYQAQRPAYIDNPSVYTGLPVTSNVQTSYRVPVASTLRRANPTPVTYQSAYVSAYPGTVAAGQPVTMTTPTASPATAFAATPVVPVVPSSAPPRTCGLGRFCTGLFGTRYTTSYYRAPVTYYRPVTSIDAVSGSVVTAQQPCTSYVQQIQRTPASSVQVGQPTLPPSTSYPAPAASSCDTNPYAVSPPSQVSPYTQSTPYGQVSPYAAPPASGVGQAGAIGSSGQTVPIPSTAPPTSGGYYAQPGYTPNVAPLTGSPPTSAQPGDRSPVDQPRLNNGAPPASPQLESTKPSTDSDTPRSYWQLQNAEDSTAMIRPNSRPIETGRDPVSLSDSDITGVEPIQAPDDYVSPFRRRSTPTPAATPAIRQTIEAPPLPGRSQDASDMTSASVRTSVPARSAALQRNRWQRQPVERQRDSTWVTIQP